ncbi:MAG TPA: DUF126 domain-containing protein, partial [Burkholderiales bacterium]|nr:DUF126 domain-containing protein [Burkholderiales bacterium]
MKQFLARQAMGRKVRGQALVARDGFSARYDLDRIAGTFSRPTHKLAGESYRDRILVLDTVKGGVASAWMLREMASRGVVPLALVFNSANPIIAQGAAFGDITLVAVDQPFGLRIAADERGGKEHDAHSTRRRVRA